MNANWASPLAAEAVAGSGSSETASVAAGAVVAAGAASATVGVGDAPVELADDVSADGASAVLADPRFEELVVVES